MLTLTQMAERMSANTWFKNPFTILSAEKKKSVASLSSDAARMLHWTRHRHVIQSLPATHESISKLSMGDLRLVASFLKPYVAVEMRDCTREDLIKFIEAHQRNVEMLLPLPPLPFGSLPELETTSVAL